MNANFKLVVPASITSYAADPVRLRERAFRDAVIESLKDETVGEVIKPFKANGQMNGHKVLDDNAAVNALIEAAPGHYRVALATTEISPFRKTQLLNTALARYFEIDRRTGKLTGQPSAAYLKQLAKSEPVKAQEPTV
jgi:hypothetical protein